jgi:hypothetical protein
MDKRQTIRPTIVIRAFRRVAFEMLAGRELSTPEGASLKNIQHWHDESDDDSPAAAAIAAFYCASQRGNKREPMTHGAVVTWLQANGDARFSQHAQAAADYLNELPAGEDGYHAALAKLIVKYAATAADQRWNVFDLGAAGRSHSVGSAQRYDGVTRFGAFVENPNDPNAHPPLDYANDNVSLALLASETDDSSHFVRNFVAVGQPTLWAGEPKSWKSTTAFDLAVSLATGKPFLNFFQVEREANVLILTGENGRSAAADTFRRVCASKGVAHAQVNGVSFTSFVPQFASVADLQTLRTRIADANAELVIIDPLAPCLSAGAASTLAIAYAELMAATNAVAAEAATLLALHHVTKGAKVKSLGLRASSGAGVSEWARAWTMFSRVGTFDTSKGTGTLSLSSGSSTGFGGSWRVDIREGLHTDPGGRVWEPVVRSKAARPERAANVKPADAEKVLSAIREIGEPATLTAIRTKARLNADKAKAAVAQLESAGSLLTVAGKVNGRPASLYQIVD